MSVDDPDGEAEAAAEAVKNVEGKEGIPIRQ
jgi:hypothetical protein